MLRFVAVAVLIVTLMSCKQSAPPRGPDAAGIITDRLQDGGKPSMRVIPASTVNCDSAADVSLVGPPRVLDSLQNEVDTTFLTVGRHVLVWSTGTIEESCPAAMRAEMILIK